MERLQSMKINKGNWTGEEVTVHYGRMDATHIQMRHDSIGDYIIRVEGSGDCSDDTTEQYNFWVRPVGIKETIVCGFITVYKYNHHKSLTNFVAWDHPCMAVEREFGNEGVNRVEGMVEVAAQVLFNIV